MSRPQKCASCTNVLTCNYRCRSCDALVCSQCAHSHGTCAACDAEQSEPGSLFDDREQGE